MAEPKICPECGEDFGDWPCEDSEGVWGTDGRNYCSAECVIMCLRRGAANRETL